MDIRRCLDILELDRDATIYKAKQAYKDLVNVWHPDRFSQAKAEVKAEASVKARAETEYHKFQAETEAKDKTEAFVEAGTGIVLSLFSYLSSAFRRIVAEAKTEIDQGELNQWQKSDDIRGKGRGKGGGGRGRGRG